MGHDFSWQLRQQNLMTKIMLRQEDEIIEHLRESKMEVARPINQIGDTILHYAAYNSLKKLMEYLLENEASPYCLNNRRLTPIDVAIPEIREWLIEKWAVRGQQRRRMLESIKERKLSLGGSPVFHKEQRPE